MRFIKMLGLAALATMIAMAFVGASSAMAAPEHPEIVLCEKSELVCGVENWHPNPTELHMEGKTAPTKLLSSIGTVECQLVLSRITLLNKLAKLIEGHLLELKIEQCNLGSTKCTVTVNGLGGLSFTPDEEKLKAIVELIELEGKTTNFTVKCGFLINCTYGAGPETKLLAETDEAGHLLLLANATPLKVAGGFCPETAKWDATLHAVNLDPTLTLKTGLWIEL